MKYGKQQGNTRTGRQEKQKGSFLDRLSEWITDRLQLDRRTGEDRKLNTDIMSLSGGRRESVREFHVKKVRLFLKMMAVCGAAALVILTGTFCRDREIRDGRIVRPGYGEGAADEELTVQIDENKYKAGGLENEDSKTKEALEEAEKILREGTTLQVDIPERQFTGKQTIEMLKQAEEEIREVFLGSNASEDEVRSALVLPAVLAGGYVSAEWTAMPYGILSDTGVPEEGIPEEGTLVTLEVDLTLQGKHRIMKTSVKVFPPERTDTEMAAFALEQEAERINRGKESDEYYLLPEKIGDLSLKWSYAWDPGLPAAALALLAIPFLVSALSDQKIREAARDRRFQLEMDYPEVLWKMTLLIGAGMNLSSAFSRIAEDYRKEKKNAAGPGNITGPGTRPGSGPGQGKMTRRKRIENKRYVYEEMLITCYEIRDGLSEGKAYENFGHRCGLPRYIRLGSVLSQNLRKGSRGLTQILEQEALASSQERQSQARKLGEKAGTKLLLPMVMMLCVVFVILVVPAFLVM